VTHTFHSAQVLAVVVCLSVCVCIETLCFPKIRQFTKFTHGPICRRNVQNMSSMIALACRNLVSVDPVTREIGRR